MIRKLQIEHVTHFFPAPEGGDLKVLEDVSFDVGAGEFVSIIGASVVLFRAYSWRRAAASTSSITRSRLPPHSWAIRLSV